VKAPRISIDTAALAVDPRIAAFVSAKGVGVERSLPRDLENSRNSAVVTTQTV
jgi:hypothetical protein